MAHESEPHDQDESRQAHDRFAMPILVPIIVFLFAALTIYGLSRIYLELDTYHVGDVGMATPLAIGVAIVILLVAVYLAARPRPAWVLAAIGLLAVGLLTGGAVWAAVHEESEIAHVEVTPTPGGTQTPGGISVSLVEFEVNADPATAPGGPVAFDVTNEGSVDHEFIVISSDLAPDALPVDDETFAVDLSALEVVGEIPIDELSAGASASTTVDMQPGPYILICNVPSHYQSGMYTGFETTPGGGPPGGPPPGGPPPGG